MTKKRHQFNLFKLADQHKTLRLSVLLSEMPNLAVAVEAGTDPDAQIDLQFGRDSRGYRTISGSITMNVSLICQRCNQLLTLRLSIEPLLALVRNDAQAKSLPDDYEPCIVEGDFFPIADLVEEELLLALPMVPKHDDVQCHE